MRWGLSLVFIVLAAGAAEASFREGPPSSMRLLSEPAPGRLLAQAAAPDMEAPLPPPPLIQAPSSQPGRTPAPPAHAPITIAPDPHAGTFVGKEVAVGALAVFATDLVAGTGFLASVLAASATRDPSSSLGLVILGAIGAILFDFVAAPFAAAAGAWFMAEKEGNNGYFGAALGAWAAQLAGGLIAVGLTVVVGLLTPPTGAPSDVAAGISGLSSLLFLALHWIGLPLGASFGIHWTGAINSTRRADFDRRREDPPTRPQELYARTTGPLVAPLVAVNF